MGRNLVIARVGRRSVHRSWLDQGKERTFDLHLCPFQEVEPGDLQGCSASEVLPGPKWLGLSQLLKSWDGWRDYDYIWLPDDDIFTTQADIEAMFTVAAELDLALFAPALQDNSHYAHYITMRNRAFFARRVGFVEIMVPGFSVAALAKLLPTLDLSETGWGWGLDSVWPKLLDYQGLGIIDAVPVFHTRPVGQFRDAELSRRVLAESDALLAQFDCRQVMVTFSGIGPSGDELALTPDELLVKLADGWRYLMDREPRILGWLASAQTRHHGAASYDVAGAPTGPFDLASLRGR